MITEIRHMMERKKVDSTKLRSLHRNCAVSMLSLIHILPLPDLVAGIHASVAKRVAALEMCIRDRLYSLEAEPEVGSVDITCYSMIRNMKDRKEPLRSPREAFKWNYNYVCTQNDAVRTLSLIHI